MLAYTCTCCSRHFLNGYILVHPSMSWFIPACPGSSCLNIRLLCSWLYPAGPAESSPFSFKFYAFVTQQGQAPTTLFLHRNAPPLPRGRRTLACAGRPVRPAAGRRRPRGGFDLERRQRWRRSLLPPPPPPVPVTAKLWPRTRISMVMLSGATNLHLKSRARATTILRMPSFSDGSVTVEDAL